MTLIRLPDDRGHALKELRIVTPSSTTMDPDKALELLARYLYDRDGDGWPRVGWDDEGEPFKQGYRDEAANVLNALWETGS